MSEVKNIPYGWVNTTLEAVAEIKYGKDHKHLKDGKIPCLGSGGLMRFVDQILYSKTSVLIPRKGTISNLFFIDEPFWTVDTLFYTKIDENKIIPKYLYFKLKTINLENMNVGSAVPSLTTAVLNQIEIVIPKDTEEQKSIAAILTAFDDKIELLQAQNKTLEETAQTIFTEWFGKYGVDDELPDGWRVGKLGDVTKTYGGTTPSTTNPDFWDGYIYWTSPKDLSNSKGIFLLNTDKKITKEGLKKISSGLLPKRTLLLSSRAPIGYLALTNIELAINQGYIAIVPEQYFSNNFMYLWLTENMKLVENASNGSTFMEISKSSFRNIDCVIPNKEILEKFDNFINPTFEKVLSNLIQIQTLTKTRDELLPRLMSGEVRVNEFKK